MTDVSVGELARQVRDVLIRFQGLADRLDSTYVSKEIFTLYKDLVDKSLKSLEESMVKTAAADAVKVLESEKVDVGTFQNLEKRVSDLEDDKKWLVRLIGAFIILGVLGFVFATSGATP